MRLRIALLAAGAAFAVAAAACSAEQVAPTPAIFGAAPWTGEERLTYDLTQRGDLEGQCVLSTEPDIEPGVTRLSRECRAADGDGADDSEVRVDAATLAPLSSGRTIDFDTYERFFETDYTAEPGMALLGTWKVNKEEGERYDIFETEREIPESDEETSVPAWYDDESLLWLVRGIVLEEDAETTFTDMNASTGRVFNADLRVEEREEVEVPAGTFEAWKVRIETSTVTHFAWVDVEAPHRVVKAQIERLTYELRTIE